MENQPGDELPSSFSFFFIKNYDKIDTKLNHSNHFKVPNLVALNTSTIYNHII